MILGGGGVSIFLFFPFDKMPNTIAQISSGSNADIMYDNILETQEHLGECRGLSWERRNLRMDTEGGKINFFKRVEKKLG